MKATLSRSLLPQVQKFLTTRAHKTAVIHGACVNLSKQLGGLSNTCLSYSEEEKVKFQLFRCTGQMEEGLWRQFKSWSCLLWNIATVLPMDVEISEPWTETLSKGYKSDRTQLSTVGLTSHLHVLKNGSISCCLFSYKSSKLEMTVH